MAIDKAKLKSAFAQIEKQHGAGTIFRLGSTRRLNVEALPTGILPVDIASGIGGLPRGRIIEIFGPPSGGKTTLTLQTIAMAQSLGGAAAFIDAENALDPTYARKLGVDIDNLIVSQPNDGEQALEVADTLVKSGQFDIIVIDSVAALVPKKELEGEMGDAQMGSMARLMSQGLRKLQGSVATTRTCLVFINQVRNKLSGYGNPETTPGGDALKFWASMRLTVRQGGTSNQIKNGQQVIGNTALIKFIKNKVAAPFREAEVTQLYGMGFDPITNMLDVSEKFKILEKNGSRYSYNGEEIANGRDNTVEMLQLDAELAGKIMAATRAAVFGVKADAVVEATVENKSQDEFTPEVQ